MSDNLNLDEIYNQLTDEQKTVLAEHLTRSKRTKWLNILAKRKGMVFTEEQLYNLNDPSFDIEWRLDKVEDAGRVSEALRCVCGRALRYRYTVCSMSTGEVLELGSEHLEQFTGLDAKTVRDILNGLKTIDFERDEILTKIAWGWRNVYEFKPDFLVPKDMLEQLRVGLPLLERQEQRLLVLLDEYEDEKYLRSLKNN